MLDPYPLEIIEEVFSHASSRDLMRLTQVSRWTKTIVAGPKSPLRHAFSLKHTAKMMLTSKVTGANRADINDFFVHVDVRRKGAKFTERWHFETFRSDSFHIDAQYEIRLAGHRQLKNRFDIKDLTKAMVDRSFAENLSKINNLSQFHQNHQHPILFGALNAPPNAHAQPEPEPEPQEVEAFIEELDSRGDINDDGRSFVVHCKNGIAVQRFIEDLAMALHSHMYLTHFGLRRIELCDLCWIYELLETHNQISGCRVSISHPVTKYMSHENVKWSQYYKRIIRNFC